MKPLLTGACDADPGGGASRDPWHRYLLLLVVLMATALWLLPLRRSLWLDETGTYWVIKDSLREAVHRAFRYQGQSPLYYVLAWLDLAAGGRSELALRLPSVLAAGGAAFLLYRLGRLLVDQQTGLMAVIAFIGLQYVIYAATDARPYAFGLLLVVGAVVALVRWFRHGRLTDAFVYVILSALTVYAHFLFGLMIVVHAVYAFWPRCPPAPVSRRAFCAAVGATGLLVLPTAPQLLSLTHRAASLSFVGEPSALELLRRLGPIIVLLGVLLVRRRSRQEVSAAGSAELALVVSWAVTATILLFVVSWLTPAKLFFGRYFVVTAAGKALLIAWVIRTMRSTRTRMALITAVAVSLAILAQSTELSDDWRGATAAVRSARGASETPVLVRSGLIESKQPGWLADEEESSYLLAPLAYYPVDGTVIPLPWGVAGDATQYLETIVRTRLEQHERFVLVTQTGTDFRRWFDRRMRAGGFAARGVGTFGHLLVVVFERRPS